ncbi:sensor histidine kinase [Propionibacteriaceae bacterium Y1685]
MPPRRPLARVAGQLWGIVLAPGDALVLVILVILRLTHRDRERQLADRAISAHVRRHGATSERPTGRRTLDYLAARVPLGLLDGLLVALIGYGLAVSVQLVLAAATGGAAPLVDVTEAGQVTWLTIAALAPLGGLALFMACSALWVTAALDHAWWQRSSRDPAAIERHLRATRAEVIDAVDGERRRIERDLHDGAQQGLVSLGLLIGRARRASGDQQVALLSQAHAESLQLLEELRTVTQQVYPVSLDRHGLARALDELAERNALDIRVRCDLRQPVPHAVAVATWFVAAEGISNAMKHTSSHGMDLDVTATGDLLRLRLADEGPGGADPEGAGLTGLRHRVNALDGHLEVSSPTGGPTVLIMEVPCV